MKKGLLVGTLFLGSTLLSFGRGVVQIKGSDTILNVTQAISEAYMKNNKKARIAVTGGGSGVGISSLINKTANIAMASRDIKKKEIEQAKKVGVDVEEVVIGYDGITVITNHGNKVKNISTEDLGKIYRGEITNWKQLGGDEGEIVVLSRDSSSGTHEFFKDHVVRNKDKKAEYGAKTLYMPSNEAIKQEIKVNKNAIGYIGMGYMDETVSKLDVDGVKATPENVSNKTYPIARAVFWYVPAKKSETITKLIEFATSPEGQKYVVSEGFVGK